MKKVSVCASLVALAATAFTPAWAQTVATEAAAADDAGSVSEIVVTARKRSESLQDVPIAVSAFGADALEQQQAQSLDDLSFAAPNIAITKNQTTSNSAQIYIRGVGQDDSTPTNEPGVGIYLDDVYLARSQGSLLDLIDVERVEVLRGPQGSLYGRNSTGGAIKLVTRRPDLQDVRFVGDVTYGRFDRIDLRGSLSVPLLEDTAAVKLDAMTFNRDGYVTRRDNGSDINRVERTGLRGALLWKLSDTADLYVTADYSWDDSGQTAPAPLTIPPAGVGKTLTGNRRPLFGYYVSDPNAADKYEFDGGGVSASLSFDTGAGQLKSVTAYRSFDNFFNSDLRGRSPASGGGSDLVRDLHQNQFTQEVQLASDSDGPLNYVVGAFYLHEKIDNLDVFLIRHDYRQKTRSIAGYADLSYDITDRLSLSVGGRYTEDKKSVDMDATGLGGVFSVRDFEAKFDEFTPKVGLSFEPNDNVLLFGSWQRGFKAGAFQGFPQRLTDLTQQVLAPEKVDSYEAGFKSTLADGRVRFNGTVFYLDYKDIQFALFNPATTGFVARTAGAEGWGTEWEVNARIADGFTLAATLGTFDSEIDDVAAGDPLLATVRGTRIKHVPKYNLQIAPAYEYALASGGAIITGGTFTYVGKIFFDATNTPFNAQPKHELVDLYLGYKGAGDRWRLTAGVQNATDQRWALTGTSAGQGSLFPALPRTWSVTLRVNY